MSTRLVIVVFDHYCNYYTQITGLVPSTSNDRHAKHRHSHDDVNHDMKAMVIGDGMVSIERNGDKQCNKRV